MGWQNYRSVEKDINIEYKYISQETILSTFSLEVIVDTFKDRPTVKIKLLLI